MAHNCQSGHYWDSLVKSCMHCNEYCQQASVITSCRDYCESLKCRSGQYYDRLLKTCVSCSAICSQHPPECSQHCAPMKTKTQLVTTLGPSSSVLIGLDGSVQLVYGLLAVSLLLLFLSLSLALLIFLRSNKVKTPEPRPQEAVDSQQSVIQHIQEDGQPLQNCKVTAPDYSRPAEPESSDDSIPTETCVCIHCFPDLKSVGHGGERAYVLYPKLVAQSNAAHQTEVNVEARIREHAAVR